MITYIYDVLFGYITFLFFEEHSAIIVHKEVAEKNQTLRLRCRSVEVQTSTVSASCLY